MIIAENLSKRFGKNILFENLSFVIADQSKTVFQGVSGKGKTTLIRMIAGLEKPSDGRLYGYDRKDISYMFQEPRLLPWENLFDNVMAPIGRDRQEEARELLGILGLSDDLMKFPTELSGGMKQRASLARALLYDKPILILDEPFSSLDEATKNNAIELVKKYSHGKTVLFISHNSDDYEKLFGDDFRIIDIN